MSRFGFNAITDAAVKALEKESIPIIRRETMWDVDAPIDYRTFKTPDRGWYYYLFKEIVYRAINDIELDYHTTPPTRHTRMVLEVVDESEQGAWHDRLIGLRSDHLGGILK